MSKEREVNPIVCPRCEAELKYIGTRQFHEGTRWGVLGNFGELLVNREQYDIYVCPHCGRVEFFIDGIGEEYRSYSKNKDGQKLDT